MSLSLIAEADLTEEIELFHVQLRHYLEAETVAIDHMDYQTHLQALHVFSLAIECFIRLVRTHAVLNSKSGGSKDGPEDLPQLEVPVP